MKLKSAPLYPCLLAAYPAVVLFSANLDSARLAQLLVPVIGAIALAGMVYLLARLVIKNSDRAAILTTVFLLLFFSYGHLFAYATRHLFKVAEVSGGGTDTVLTSQRYLHLALSGCFILILLLVARFQFVRRLRPAAGVTSLMTVVSAVLISMPAARIVWSSFTATTRAAVTESSGNTASSVQPDFFYIILDGYARDDVLLRHYNMDNTPFLEALRASGFVIPTKSRTNYWWTFLSIPSSLNMAYLNSLASDDELSASSNRQVPYQMLRDNAVLHFLKPRGYKYIHVGSTWGGTLDNPYADIQLNCAHGLFTVELHRVLFESSWLKVFEHSVASDLAECALHSFSSLEEAAKIPGPKFVFAHIPLPHHPYLFDSRGNTLQNVTLSDQVDRQNLLWGDKTSYIEQLKFVNDRTMKTVIEIQRNSATPPVIVLQSDHGPDLPDLPDEERARARLRNFTALHLPNASMELPEVVSPVNIWRMIFNEYFDANMRLLNNRSYRSSFQRPFRVSSVKVEEE